MRGIKSENTKSRFHFKCMKVFVFNVRTNRSLTIEYYLSGTQTFKMSQDRIIAKTSY